jgi:hypothetical protein
LPKGPFLFCRNLAEIAAQGLVSLKPDSQKREAEGLEPEAESLKPKAWSLEPEAIDHAVKMDS